MPDSGNLRKCSFHKITFKCTHPGAVLFRTAQGNKQKQTEWNGNKPSRAWFTTARRDAAAYIYSRDYGKTVATSFEGRTNKRIKQCSLSGGQSQDAQI